MSGFVKRHPALSLFLLAVLLGPGLVAPVLLGVAPRGFVQLGALSASAAGLILAAVEGGWAAVRELIRRALIWRVGLGWWLVALVFPAVPALGALYLTATLDRGGVWPSLGPWYQFVSMLLFQIVFAGVGEEFGWRGFALPRLQRRHTALVASLIIGGFHAAWHLPLFFLPGDTYATLVSELGLIPAFLGYAALVVSLAVLLTWMFNSTGGSVLIAASFHGAVNAWNNFLDIAGGGTTALLRYVALLAVVSVIVAVGFGPTNLSRRTRNSLGNGDAATG
jgi:membrane protease YdiL (CAAX protease family)